MNLKDGAEHLWFAWHPVPAYDGRRGGKSWVWWRPVFRRWHEYNDWPFGWGWEYSVNG